MAATKAKRRNLPALTAQNVKKSPAYMTLAKRARSAAERARNIQSEVTQSAVPRALMGGGAVLTGAVAAGALRAFIGDNLMGVPADVAAGLVVGTAGVALGSPLAVFGAVGLLAGFVSDRTEEQILTWQIGAATNGTADAATAAAPVDEGTIPFASGTAGGGF